MTADQQPDLEELSEDQCWRLLAAKSIGRLAVSIENRPDIFPVNYRLDEETVIVRTAPGLKLAAAVLGSGVAFEVDSLDELRHSGWSIVVRGSATEVESLEELAEIERLMVEPWARGQKNRYLRLQPEHVTGRRIPDRAAFTEITT